MKALKIIGFFILIILILFFGIALFLPSQVQVERSLEIPASSEIIFSQINDLQQWTKWSPWHKADPNMDITYETTVGEGASYRWQSKEMGQGQLTITESLPHHYIETELDFMEQGTATAYYRLEPVKGGTKVVWAFETDMGDSPVAKYMGLFMDSMIGKDFEQGLQNLRAHVTSLPPKMMTTDTPPNSK